MLHSERHYHVEEHFHCACTETVIYELPVNICVVLKHHVTLWNDLWPRALGGVSYTRFHIFNKSIRF